MDDDNDQNQNVCFLEVDQFDVTIFIEAILYFVLIMIAIWLLVRVIKNLQIIYQNFLITTSMKQVRNINLILLIVLILEIAQKLEQLGFYFAKKLNDNKIDTSYLFVICCIYQILMQFKIFLLYFCILYSSKLWYQAIHEINDERNNDVFKWIYYSLKILLILAFLFNCSYYIFDCKNTLPRFIALLSTSILVFSVFLYTARLFKLQINQNRVPQYFNQRFTIFMYILYIGVSVRAIFYFIQILNHQLLKEIKQYKYTDQEDQGYGWLIFQIFFQPLVNFFPIFFISLMFSPKGLVEDPLIS